MTTLLFLATVIAIVILVISAVSNAIHGKSVRKKLRLTAILIGAYALAWLGFFFVRADTPVPFGADSCFDDWCATVTKIDKASSLGNGADKIRAEGRFIILHVKMSNHARGIAQKPSEPRIHIIDRQGHYWAASQRGLRALESVDGPQKDIGKRLELHESSETELVFDIPWNATGLIALIEEGPFITKLLLPTDREIYLL